MYYDCKEGNMKRYFFWVWRRAVILSLPAFVAMGMHLLWISTALSVLALIVAMRRFDYYLHRVKDGERLQPRPLLYCECKRNGWGVVCILLALNFGAIYPMITKFAWAPLTISLIFIFQILGAMFSTWDARRFYKPDFSGWCV